jgi:hypothetical protein
MPKQDVEKAAEETVDALGSSVLAPIRDALSTDQSTTAELADAEARLEDALVTLVATGHT